jgi:hypothetical protein
MVLGKVATQWKSQGGTSQALKSLFAEQRDNIANAVPAGFSLADISVSSEIRKPTHSTTHTRERGPVAARSPLSWLLPVGLALLGGFILWQFLSRPKAIPPVARTVAPTADEVRVLKPVVPDVEIPSLDRVRDDLGGLFKSLDTTFTDIRDASSAERAMPALRELNTKIDSMNQLLSRLPEANRAMLRPALADQVKIAAEKANAANSIEGIGADFKSLIQEILVKITKWITADSR